MASALSPLAKPETFQDLEKLRKTLPQVEAILTAPVVADPAGTPYGLRVRAILETLSATGMRVTELRTLRGTQLLFEYDLVRVIGKGNKERLVPIGSMAQEWIERYRREAEDRKRAREIQRWWLTADNDLIRQPARLILAGVYLP